MNKLNKNLKSAIMYSVFALIAIAAVIMLIFFKKEEKKLNSAIEPTVAPPPTSVVITSSPTPKVENSIEKTGGMVFASDKLSFGLASNGRVSYIGSNEGQAYCFEWNKIVQICGNSNFTAGLSEDGTVLVSGSEELKATVSSWENIVFLAASDTTLYSLTKDGRILSSDASENGITGAIMIATGSDFVVFQLHDGTLTGFGNLPNLTVFEGESLIQIECGNDFVCGLTDEGKFLTTKASSASSPSFTDIEGIKRIFACNDTTAIIDEAGTLHTDCEFIEGEIENVHWFSSGFEHALVLLDDGRVLSFGDNEYMQCETDNWRLRPYSTEDGYILGLTVGEVKADGSLVRTGDSYTLENETSGIALILGDIDMNGKIDENDSVLLEGYLLGTMELSDIQLHAANVLQAEENESSVDEADAEQLLYHLNGFTEIDQYARSFTYSSEIADAECVNRDAVGYIKLDGTNIEYPLMYGDNFYYHYHNAAGVATSRGSIYLYYPTPTKNIVITGHNLRKPKIMLYELHKIQDEYAEGYSIFKNRIWVVNVYGETHYWEVFAMYEEKPADKAHSSQYYNCNYNYTMDSMTDEQIQEWIDYQVQRTELDYTPFVTPEDRFITILTCSDHHWESNLGGRIYFFLRRMDGR